MDGYGFTIMVIAVILAYRVGFQRGGIKAEIAAQKRIVEWQTRQDKEVH